VSSARTRILVAAGIALVWCAQAVAAQQPPRPDERIEWWREARFGMFIHWGLYAVLGGEWNGEDHGKEMGGASAEWIMLRAPVPTPEYEKLAERFNPVRFDAKAWVSLAKEAGMKYMVITAKHHDGFAMFDSRVTAYDIIDATPFDRDPIRELADECRRQGIRFGVYYSHSKDWRNRGRQGRSQPSDAYVRLVEGQLRELLTNYGDLAVLWFDMGDKYTAINTRYGKMVKDLQPQCLISGRLGGERSISDYRQEKDRTIPGKRVHGDAETPMTMRDNWGYDRDDDNWKTVKDLLERLSLTACRGANMLLNVGPRPDGALCPEEIERLKAIGAWMKVNGEAIYGTTASPVDFDFPWGAMSRRASQQYLHVLTWDPAGIRFNGIRSKPARAYLLADPKKAPLAVEHEPKTGVTTVRVPAEAPDPNVSVIVVEFAGPIEADPQAEGTYHWVKGTGVKVQRRGK